MNEDPDAQADDDARTGRDPRVDGDARADIRPIPTDEEAVAISAAITALWPVPVVIDDDLSTRDTAWKFSGRWWNRPVSVRRDRPYR